MKRKIGKIIAIIIIFALAFVGSYAITYYVDEKNDSKKEAIVEVVYEDANYYAIPNSNVLTEEEALLEWPYKFMVKNTGNTGGVYQILLKDFEENDLSRDNLSYLLYLNDKMVKKGDLSDIVNDVLYESSIDPSKDQKYQLYIYKNKEIEGTIYQYSIILNAVLEGGPGF